jgi:hypothetical protein
MMGPCAAPNDTSSLIFCGHGIYQDAKRIAAVALFRVEPLWSFRRRGGYRNSDY